MLHTLRPTPTCTRFQVTIEMPCIKCTAPMRLALIEPRRRALDLLPTTASAAMPMRAF
jgi:hypothetical protein